METTVATTIAPIPPYDFLLTAGQPSYSRNQEYKTEEYTDDAYIRLLDLGDKVALASVRSTGAVDDPELSVTLTGDDLDDSDGKRAAAQLTWLLGCDQDLRPFYDSVSGDPVLADVVTDFYGYHNTRTASVYEALVQAVMGQQIATAVARIVRNLLVQHYGVRATIAGREWYAFPRAADLAVAEIDDLRQLKLSYRKSEYIQGIARAALDAPEGFEEMHHLPDDDVVRQMVALRGGGQLDGAVGAGTCPGPPGRISGGATWRCAGPWRPCTSTGQRSPTGSCWISRPAGRLGVPMPRRTCLPRCAPVGSPGLNRHSRARGNPGQLIGGRLWIPAFSGMTD